MENSMIKKASEELLRIADEIEKEASEKIFFACNLCDHKSNLATIDAARRAASEANSDSLTTVVVASISVEDSLYCPQCDGVMKYAATEESEKYIVEATEQDYDTKEAAKEEKVEEKAEEKAEEKTEEKPEEKEAAKEENKEEDTLVKKAASMGLDLDAIARYSDI